MPYKYRIDAQVSTSYVGNSDPTVLSVKFIEIMSLARILNEFKLIRPERLLEFYPPFLFMGAKVLDASDNYQFLHIRLPLRWYAKNMHGTMFGGFVCAVSDPLPALMCSRIFPKSEVFTKSHLVEFLRPARSALEVKIKISDKQVSEMKKHLDETSRATHTFEFFFKDKRGRDVAWVKNTVFLRRYEGKGRLKSKEASPSENV